MENAYQKNYIISTSLCDAQGRLGIKNIFDICMDMASEHAAKLGVSYYEMLDRRCFWVAVRTRVRLYERPLLGSVITAETWPGKPGLAKCDRFYRLTENEKLLAEGRTEWAAQDVDTGMVRKVSTIGYPADMLHREEKLCAEPFSRFKGFEAGPQDRVAAYTVGSMDIDVGRHMNNVAYIRMLLGTFTTAEMEAMDIAEAEISYRTACFEGQTLEIYRTVTPEGIYFQVRDPDGNTAVQAILKTR